MQNSTRFVSIFIYTYNEVKNVKIQSIALEEGKLASFKINWIDFNVFLCSFFLGTLALNAISVVMNYVLTSYFYHRYPNKTLISLLAYLGGALLMGPFMFYQHVLIVAIYTFCIAFVKIVKGNLYIYFPLIVALIGFVSGIVLHASLVMSYTTALLAYAVCLISIKHVNADSEGLVLNSMTFSILVIGMIAGLQLLLPSWLSFSVLIFGYLLLALSVDTSALSLAMLLGYGLIGLTEIHLASMIGVLFVSCLKDCGKGAQYFCFTLPVLISNGNLISAIHALGIMMCAHFISLTGIHSWVEQKRDVRFEMQQLASKERILEHQLNQFSQIYLLAAKFFSPTHRKEVTFLSGMAKSMEILAMQLKQSTLHMQDESLRIYQLLKGYHYDVNRVHVDDGELGQKMISIYFEQCDKEEVEDVILPLLQMVIDHHLKVASFEVNPLLKSSAHLVLSGIKPMRVHGNIIISERDQESGDTCKMFKIKQNTVCLLSDGMGSGDEAKRLSEFSSLLMQRLLSIGIPVEMAVQSLNSMLQIHQSESFATLDVMLFDAYHHQVYLCKSGACVTFLYRDGRVVKIQGESLPLGIIEHVEADCFKMDCKEDDVLIMCSDGIEEQWIEKWIQESNGEVLANKFMKELEKQEVLDDISLMITKVICN